MQTPYFLLIMNVYAMNETIGTATINWWLITGLIGILVISLGYFGKRMISSVESAIKELTVVVDELKNFMILQTEKNKQFDEIWDKVETHDDKIEQLERTHLACTKNNKVCNG